jgi:phage I-like protein
MSQKKSNSDFATNLNEFAMGSRFTTTARSLICNRESEKSTFSLPEDGWSMLIPMGEFPGEAILPDGTKKPVIQIFDRKGLEKIVAEYSAAETLIDYEHFSHDLDKATNAGGWFSEIELRDDGVYSKNRYSAQGRADVEGGNYRYISPEFDSVEVVEGNRVRPQKLSGAALTNRPALKTLKPLSNREGTHTETKPKDSMNKIIAALAPFLALPTDAEEATVLNRLGEIPTDTTLEGLLADQTEIVSLRNRNKELLDAQVEADLDRFESEGVIKNRASVKKLLLANREDTIAMLEELKPSAQEAPARVFNRSTAKAPEVDLDQLKTQADQQEAAVQDYKIKNRCGYEAAFDAVKREKPELFQAGK